MFCTCACICYVQCVYLHCLMKILFTDLMFWCRICWLSLFARGKCSMWIKPRSQAYWNSVKAGLFGEEWWVANLRMTRRTFIKSCTELHPYLEKTATRFRLPIPVDEQLAVTIWRLATNVEYRTIAALFGIGISTVCEIIHKTCKVVTQHLPPEERLKDVIDDFENSPK